MDNDKTPSSFESHMDRLTQEAIKLVDQVRENAESQEIDEDDPLADILGSATRAPNGDGEDDDEEDEEEEPFEEKVDDVFEAGLVPELPGSNPALRPDNALKPVPMLLDHTNDQNKWVYGYVDWRAREVAAWRAEKAAKKAAELEGKPREMVTFEVQKTQVNLPRDILKESEVFGPILASLDASKRKDQPIVLQNVTLADFGALVKAVYPTGESNEELSENEWISVLDLASKWKLVDVRQAAIRYFLYLPDHPYVKKLALGKEYSCASLVRSAYLDLLIRQAHFSQDELDHLGIDIVLKLAAIREEVYQTYWTYTWNWISKEWHEWSEHAAQTIFQDEIAKMNSPSSDLVGQILIARKAGYPDLLKLGCLKLSEREASLTAEEFGLLGPELGLKILEARLEFRRIAYEAHQLKMQMGHCEVPIQKLLDGIDKGFEEEIKGLEESYQSYQPSFPGVFAPGVGLSESSFSVGASVPVSV